MNSFAAQAIGTLPAFVIAITLSLINVIHCESKGRECGDAKAIVMGILGVGGGGMMGQRIGWEQGYNTLNPNLRRDPVEDRPPEPRAEPQLPDIPEKIADAQGAVSAVRRLFK